VVYPAIAPDIFLDTLAFHLGDLDIAPEMGTSLATSLGHGFEERSPLLIGNIGKMLAAVLEHDDVQPAAPDQPPPVVLVFRRFVEAEIAEHLCTIQDEERGHCHWKPHGGFARVHQSWVKLLDVGIPVVPAHVDFVRDVPGIEGRMIGNAVGNLPDVTAAQVEFLLQVERNEPIFIEASIKNDLEIVFAAQV